MQGYLKEREQRRDINRKTVESINSKLKKGVLAEDEWKMVTTAVRGKGPALMSQQTADDTR